MTTQTTSDFNRPAYIALVVGKGLTTSEIAQHLPDKTLKQAAVTNRPIIISQRELSNLLHSVSSEFVAPLENKVNQQQLKDKNIKIAEQDKTIRALQVKVERFEKTLALKDKNIMAQRVEMNDMLTELEDSNAKVSRLTKEKLQLLQMNEALVSSLRQTI